MFAILVLALSLTQPSPPSMLHDVQATTTVHGSATVMTQRETSSGGVAEKGVAEIIAGLTGAAENFQNTVKDVETLMNESKESQEKGAAALDRMLVALHGAEASVSEQSQIWIQCTTLLKLWQDRQKQIAQKAVQDPRYAEMADAWSSRINQAAGLRTNITSERNRLNAAIADAERNKEFLVDLYSLGAADKVLAGLQKMNDQLKALGDGLAGMVAQAQKMKAGPAS